MCGPGPPGVGLFHYLAQHARRVFAWSSGAPFVTGNTSALSAASPSGAQSLLRFAPLVVRGRGR